MRTWRTAPSRCPPQPAYGARTSPLPGLQSPIRASSREIPLELGLVGRGGSEEVAGGEPPKQKGRAGQTSQRYLNWLASEMFIAHLHICRLLHRSKSSDCFTLGEWRTESVKGPGWTKCRHSQPCSLTCQVLGWFFILTVYSYFGCSRCSGTWGLANS